MLLSATMIVKNEELMIERCLNSIKDICDEIIIVDTGSTDRTVEIAEKFGAQIYHHPWQNDFSLHRNQAFSYASGEWFLVIDADEEIIIPDPSSFRKRLADIPPTISALALNVGEAGPDGEIGNNSTWLGARFFRKSSNPAYRNIVHNKVSYSGHCAGTNIILKHYGYSSISKEKQQEKHARTMALLDKRLEDDPNDYNAMYYKAQMHIASKDFDKTIYWALRCLRKIPIEDGRDLSYYGVLYYYLASSYLLKNDGPKAYPCIIKGLEFFPDDIDLTWVMARYAYHIDNKELLHDYALRYKELLAEYRDRIEHNYDPKPFATVIHKGDIKNRTIYCTSSEHEKLIDIWLDSL